MYKVGMNLGRSKDIEQDIEQGKISNLSLK